MTVAPTFWRTSGTKNQIKFAPDNSNYCLSNVVFKLEFAQRLIAVSSSELTFPNLKSLTSFVRELTITNDGDAELDVSSLGFSGDGANAYSVVEPSPTNFKVAANGGTKLVKVRFTPSGTGSFPAKLLINSNAANSVTEVTLSGTGVPYATDLSVPKLDFGDQRVNVEVTKDVTVRNAGASDITLSSIALTSSTPSQFSLVDPGGASFTLKAHESLTLQVKFRPTAETVAALTGALAFNVAGDGLPSFQVDLSGKGVKPTLEFDPEAALAFDPQRLTQATTKTLTIRNTGSKAIALSSFAISGNTDFTLVSPPTSAVTLTKGGSPLVLTVQFLPTTETSTDLNATLGFVTDDLVSYASVSVPLSGRGVKPTLVLDPSNAFVFGPQRAGTAVTKTLSVSNSGSGPIKITGFTLTGDPAFTPIAIPGTPVTLTKTDAPLQVKVQFLPTGVTASASPDLSGSLQITTEDLSYLNVPVTVSGRGVKPVLVLNPTTPLAFGTQRVGDSATKTLTLSNTGDDPITLDSFAVTGAGFSLVSPPSGSVTLTKGGSSLVLTVQFLPAVESATDSTGTLSFKGSDSDYANTNVALSGRGIKPTLVFDPGAVLAFGTQRVGDPITKTLTLRNTGDQSITLNTFAVTGTGFSLVSPPSGTVTLTKGGSPLVLTVQFLPTTATATDSTGTLSFKSGDKDYLDTSVTLSGRGIKPTLVLDPSGTLAFGPRRVDEAASKTLTVTNTGDLAVTLTDFAVTGGGFTLLSSSQPSPVTLTKGGAPLVLTVQFLPTAESSTDSIGTLSFKGSDKDYTNTNVALSGRGVKPTLVFDPGTTLDYGPQRVGDASIRTVTISNTGDQSISITDFQVSGHESFTFVSSSRSKPVTLVKGGEPLVLTVQFLPTSETAGGFTGVLAITGSDSAYASVPVNLKGSGVKPVLLLEPDTGIAFGPQRVGDPTTRTLTVSNTGSGSITLNTFATSGPGFSLVSPPTTPVTLTKTSAPLVLTVQFTPASVTTTDVMGALSFKSTDTAYLTTTVPLSGRGVSPALVFEPGTSLAFGAQRVGVPVIKTVTVRNEGDSSITLNTFAVSGPGFTLSSTSLPSPVTLVKGGAPLVFSVRFLPTTESTTDVTGALTFKSTDKDYPNLSVPLSGRGVTPLLVFDPGTSLAFEEQRMGVVATKTLTVRNTGDSPITLNTFSVTGNADFSLGASPGEPVTLTKGGAPLVLTVKFLPSLETATNVTGTLTLTSNDSAYLDIPVTLSGRGVNPMLSVSTAPISFDVQNVGTSSPVRTLSLSNIGSGTLRVYDIIASAPFSLVSSAPFDVTNTGPKELGVRFTPGVVGKYDQLLTFKTNDPNHASVSIQLLGEGALLLTVTPATLDFAGVPKGTSAQKTFTVTNNGTGSITLQALTFNPTLPYTSTFTTPVVLSPSNRSETITVTFSPTEKATYPAELTVQSTAANKPKVTLTGKGTAPAIKLAIDGVDQSTLRFGEVALGQVVTKLVRIQNIGDEKLTLGTFSIDTGTSGPFDYVKPSAVEIAAGEEVSASVSFRPTANDTSTAKFRVESNAVNGLVELGLEGAGVAADISLLETPIDFGTLKVLSTSATRQLAITNPGKANLEITGISVGPDYIATPPTPTLPWVILPKQSQTLLLKFNPQTFGVLPSELTLSSNAYGKPTKKVSLTGQGVDGFPECSGVCDVSFTAVDVGSTATHNIQIINKNRGLDTDGKSSTINLILQSATVSTPTGESPFTLLGFTPDYPLAPGEGRPLSIVFSPTARVSYKGTLTINTNSATTPKLTIPLSGEATGADPQYNKNVTFERTNVGTSSSHSLLITNNGEKDLIITRVSFGSAGGTDGTDMALDFDSPLKPGGGASEVVIPKNGGTGTVLLKFVPRKVGERTALATLLSNAKPPITLTVTGEGTSPELKVVEPAPPLPPKLDIEGVLVGRSSPPVPLRIQNMGTGPVSVRAELSPASMSEYFEITGTDASGVSVIGPGAQLPLYVTFKPTVDRLSAFASLLVKPDNPLLPTIEVPLRGVGILQPIETPSELVFGKQLINSVAKRTLNLLNRSNSAINVRELKIEGDNCSVLKAESSRLAIEPFKSAELTINFTPASTVAVNCKLKLFFTEFTESREVLISGEGISSVLSIEPLALDFGGGRVGDENRTGRLTLKNLSSDPIILARPFEQSPVGERFTFDSPVEGVQIEPGQSYLVIVKYLPRKETLSEVTMQFSTVKPSAASPIGVFMEGKATQRILVADREFLDFGRVDASAKVEDTKREITVSNISSSSQRVLVSVKNADSPFAVGSSGVSIAIPSQGNSTFSVTFDPEGAGDVTDEILVRLQDSTEPEISIPVKGTGRVLVGHGAGCSSSSSAMGSASLVALLALVGLHARRRRHR